MNYPPTVGQWYRHLDKGERFQVTAVDERGKTIEIQCFGGDLDEIDFTRWPAMPLAISAAPEDWTGPIDDVESDDFGYSVRTATANDWQAKLASLPADSEAWEDMTEWTSWAPSGSAEQSAVKRLA